MATTAQVDLSLREKVCILQALEQPGASQATVARDLGVHRPTVSRLLKSKEATLEEYRKFDIKPDRKRKTEGEIRVIEDALLLGPNTYWPKELQ